MVARARVAMRRRRALPARMEAGVEEAGMGRAARLEADSRAAAAAAAATAVAVGSAAKGEAATRAAAAHCHDRISWASADSTLPLLRE